jgi:hypothetical protein
LNDRLEGVQYNPNDENCVSFSMEMGSRSSAEDTNDRVRVVSPSIFITVYKGKHRGNYKYSRLKKGNWQATKSEHGD